MRQYAGFATAEETNARFRYLLAAGAPGLSTAFDLPTQLGMDSDDPLAAGEVGRVGVAIDSIDDMARLFDGIPLDRVSTSMTINAPAAVLLLLYQLVAEEGGADPRELRGTIQNDILKEYVARGNYVYPPVPSMRLTTDTFAYCDAELPKWNTISISGYHIREAGSTAVQEVAFTLANGIAYVEAAIAAGLEVDRFAPRLSFFFNAHNNLMEEVAKFRAARSLWAHIMRDRFGATQPRAMSLRFHAQTGGSTLTAQQPRNNVVRVALQVLAAALGGAQSIHSNGFDEALALPDGGVGQAGAAHPAGHRRRVGHHRHGRPARGLLVRGAPDRRDRGAGPRADRRGRPPRRRRRVHRVDARGDRRRRVPPPRGGAGGLPDGGRASTRSARTTSSRCRSTGSTRRSRRTRWPASPLCARPATPPPCPRASTRSARRHAASDNLLYPMREALRARATVGEVCGVLREEFGEYDRILAARG